LKLFQISDLRNGYLDTGAIFGVSKDLINKNSKEFYTRCLEILDKSSDVTNPSEGHAFERSWYLIFN